MSNTRSPVIAQWGYVFLLIIGIDIALIATSIAMDTHLLGQPESWQYIGEPLALLAVYTVLIYRICLRPTSLRLQAIQIGASFGIVTGLLWMVNLSLETFIDQAGIPVTAPFLLGGFVLWSVAGFVAATRTHTFSLGILAASWSAMMCVIITITFGFLLPFFADARLQYLLSNDPDYRRSGWTNLHDFVLANQFDSAFSHLLGALVVGTLVGAIGSGIALGIRGRGSLAS